MTRKRVADVISELIAAKEARGKSARYVGDLRVRLKRFAETFAVGISTMTTADVQRWLDGLKLAPQTAKNFRTLLHTLFAFAQSRGYVFKGGNPLQKRKNFSQRRQHSDFHARRNRPSTQSREPIFCHCLRLAHSPDFAPPRLSGWNGARLTLQAAFSTSAADKAKTRSRRLVPVLPNLAQWLAPYSKHTGKIWKRTTNDLQDGRAKP